MKRATAYLLVALFVLGGPAFAFASLEGDPIDVSIPGLIAIDRALDGTEVSFTGEAIGEDLHADDGHRWVNVLGEGVVIGVYVTNEQAAQIQIYGDHQHQGAIVEVMGPVHIGCDEHGGEFDVHAEEVRVLEPGSATDRPITPWKAIAAGVMLVVALVEVRVFRGMLDRRMS